MTILTWLLLLGGFFLLIKGADWLVIGARQIAARFGLSEMLIGITLVSWGTSMPELVVSLFAGLRNEPDLVIGNVLGSNIANILLILGATALVRPLPVHQKTVLSEIPFSLAAALLIGFVANSSLMHGDAGMPMITRLDGLLILFFFIMFMIYVFKVAFDDKQLALAPPADVSLPMGRTVLMILVGCVALFGGGHLVVGSASSIALSLGMSQAFVGLTVVALGTSLPELVTSVRAARMGSTDIAVANVVGSNIFNLLWILGLTSMVTPLSFDAKSNIDIIVVIVSSTMVILVMVVGKQMRISRWAGVLFLLGYVAYLLHLLQRG